MSVRHGDRVAVELQQEACAEEGLRCGSCLPAFQFVRAGLIIDEYHAHADMPYDEELGKRVDAALSLSRPDDSFATYAVHVASRVARELQEELCKQDAISKSDSSPVTVADFSVQAIVLGVLSRYFPGHGFIAEETSPVLRRDPSSLSSVLAVVSRVLGLDLTEAELCAAIDLGTRGHGKHERGHWGRGGRTWVLDPIDGTKGFLRGEQFCVALGLLDGGKAVAGILGCPNLPADDEHPGQKSSGGAEAEEARCGRGLSYYVRTDSKNTPVYICAEQGGIYLRLPRWGYVENIWDHVAGAVVIREAGGKVTDSRGEPLDFSLGGKLPRERGSSGSAGQFFSAVAWDHAGLDCLDAGIVQPSPLRGAGTLSPLLLENVVGVVATSGKIHAEVLRAVHNRQIEDWARVVAGAKGDGWESGDKAPQLPGVDWSYWNHGREGVGEEWWARAAEQRQPLVMRTSAQFYGTLERGWDKLVAVLFHGSWTQESQHAVSILESLASRQQIPELQVQHRQQQQHEEVRQKQQYPPSLVPDFDLKQSQSPSPSSTSTATTTEALTKAGTMKMCVGAGEQSTDTIPVLLAEADVMSLIDVADRQAITGLPSLHLHLGGREIVRFPVDTGETSDSLGARIDEVASLVCEAGRQCQR
eukprot:jgi/Undpi1/5954/HiC_scaffold_2.g01228.m1